MSASLMSCVRQNSPPLEPELSADDATLATNAALSASANASFASDHETGGHNSSSRTTTATNTSATNSSSNTAAAAADDASQSSQQTNTQKRRRRFQPLRKLRRMFRLSSGPDADASSVSTSSVYKPASERDFSDEYSIGGGGGGQLSPAQSTGGHPSDQGIRLAADSVSSPQRPHREPRQQRHSTAVPYDATQPPASHAKADRRTSSQQQPQSSVYHHGGKPVLHLRHDSRESIYRETADHHHHLQQYHQYQHQNHHSGHHPHHQQHHGGHAPHRQASDAVDFQQHSGPLAAAAAAAKRRSNSECLGGDLKSEPLSQSHDSVFSESVTASSISIGLKAELTSVLAKKYAGRRTGDRAPAHGNGDHDRANDGAAATEDDDEDDEEDLGLPRSPNTPMRGTRALAVGGSGNSRRTSSSVASPMPLSSLRTHSHSHQHSHHVSSDGSLSMLSMESSELIGGGGGGGGGSGKLRLANRYQSETDVDIGLPVTVLNHSAARHKMAVRPKRKQAPSRMLRPPPRSIDETAVADTVDAASDTSAAMPREPADRAGRSKSSSLPPGMNAKQLPQHAANRSTRVTVNESDPRNMYANRSLSKSFDFDATDMGSKTSPAGAVVHVTEKETSKEMSGFFRRLLTYGSLKKKPSATAASAKSTTADLPPLNTYVPSNVSVAVVVAPLPTPPDILPKPTIKADKPRSGPASRQRVLPRELSVVPAPASTSSATSLVSRHHHSIDKLPPISPSTKKPTALDHGSAECVHAGRQHSTECLHVPMPPHKPHPPTDSTHHITAMKRSSTELPARPFELDHANQSGTSAGATATAFPLYRSDEQLYPRTKSGASAAITSMLPTRFSSTSCIMRPPAVHQAPPSFVPKSAASASSAGSSAKSSPARRSVEKSKSFRFYADTSADSASASMHSSAGHMPSLPDLSCWSTSSSNSAAVTLDSSPSRSRSSHSPNHRQLINKFEINDNNLVVSKEPPSRLLSSCDAALVTVSSRDLRNSVVVTTTTPLVASGGPVVRKTSAVDMSMTSIEDNIDRIMKFACVTVVKTPIGTQLQSQVAGDAAPVETNSRRFSNESVEITDQVVPCLLASAAITTTLIERRPSVTDERLKFERRIQSEAVETLSPSPSCSESTSDPLSTANSAAAPVVMRKKSVSYNSRPQSTANNGRAQPQPVVSTKSADDQTPELMKVFARRSLKLKDTFYVTDEPMSMTPCTGVGDAVESPALDNPLPENVINNNNNNTATVSAGSAKTKSSAAAGSRSSDPKPTAVPADKPQQQPTKAVGTATVAAATVATAWLSNCQTPAVAATAKTNAKMPTGAVLSARSSGGGPTLGVPKAALFNNNMLISNNNHSNNNHNAVSGTAALRSAEDKANANVAVADNAIPAAVDDVKLRQSVTSAPKDGSSANDEFKGILQRKAEWEKRATQQFK